MLGIMHDIAMSTVDKIFAAIAITVRTTESTQEVSTGRAIVVRCVSELSLASLPLLLLPAIRVGPSKRRAREQAVEYRHKSAIQARSEPHTEFRHRRHQADGRERRHALFHAHRRLGRAAQPEVQ